MTTPKNPIEIQSNDEGERLYLSVSEYAFNDLKCALTNILVLRLRLHQAFGSVWCLKPMDFVAQAIEKVISKQDGHH